MTRRIFAAVDITNDVREAVAGHIDVLRAIDTDRCIRWTRPDKLHITLKFLARASDREVSALQGVLEEIAGNNRRFSSELIGSGIFPREKRARVLWLGIEQGTSELASIAAEIESLGRDSGIEAEERSFRPHLTIGRVRDRRRASAVVGSHLAMGFPAAAFEVSRLVLYESCLTPGGSRYELLSVHELG